jgi:hypothetical protein
VTRIPAKRTRVRLDTRSMTPFATRCYVAMVGDASRAAQCPISRFTTKSFAATPATIAKKIWSHSALSAMLICITAEGLARISRRKPSAAKRVKFWLSAYEKIGIAGKL